MLNPAHPFLLTPFAASASVRALGGEVRRREEGLQLSWRLEGELSLLRIPPAVEPRFADELWRHTCFELFVAEAGEAAYLEFNFSPSGQWAAYAFAGYRERVAAPDLERRAPTLQLTQRTEALELTAELPLPERFRAVPLSLNLTAVVEERDGTLGYWALCHPAGKPDFHHPDARILKLDEIRN